MAESDNSDSPAQGDQLGTASSLANQWNKRSQIFCSPTPPTFARSRVVTSNTKNTEQYVTRNFVVCNFLMLLGFISLTSLAHKMFNWIIIVLRFFQIKVIWKTRNVYLIGTGLWWGGVEVSF